ncbi:MAG: hypothetical protein HYV35_02435 [Lentisphaerae bacterium]|nr:hypothetical protein [Lentisphaerota bacterium]
MKLIWPDWLGALARRWMALVGLPAVARVAVAILLLTLSAASVAGTHEDVSDQWAAYYDWIERVAPEHETTQALLDFRPTLTEGDSLRGLWPPWLARVFKVQGEWAESVNAWYVPAGEVGKLVFCLDRSRLQQNLIMEIEFFDGSAGGAMFVDLVNSNEEVLLSSQAYENGNLIEGSEEVVRKSLFVPLVDYPQAAGVAISGVGEVFVLGGALYLFESGRANPLDEPGLASDVGEPLPDGSVGEGRSDERQRHGQSDVGAVGNNRKGAALQARQIKATSLGQYVLSLMAGTEYAMPRYVLPGGGGRMASSNFILECSFGQGAPVGFSYGSNFTLRAGYQQQVEMARLEARVTLKPEALNINPGILTAFVSLPEGYPASGITSATCDGALYERMMLSDDGAEMVIKFRRQDIEAALAEQDEALDTYFVVEVTWQGDIGTLVLRGEDDITRIVN